MIPFSDKLANLAAVAVIIIFPFLAYASADAPYSDKAKGAVAGLLMGLAVLALVYVFKRSVRLRRRQV